MNARILIADDDEVSCQLFAETLEGEGLRCGKGNLRRPGTRALK
jgi:CheY-like chemotaxis protein